MTDARTDLPIPELEGRQITYEEYWTHTPEKLELIQGHLIEGPGQLEERRRLLALLLTNVGLLEAVALAPAARWHEALDRVRGPAGRG